MANWKVVVTDLLYTPLGELTDVFELNLARRINGVDSLSFRVREDNRFFALLGSQEAHVKVYRNGRLEFFGPVWSAEITGDAQKVSLAVACSGPGRLAEKITPTLASLGVPAGSPPNWVWGNWVDAGTYDRGHLLHLYYVQALTSEPGGERRSTQGMPGAWERATLPFYIPLTPLGYLSTINYKTLPLEFPTLQDVITQLGAGTAGFDWKWTPTEATPIRYTNSNAPWDMFANHGTITYDYTQIKPEIKNTADALLSDFNDFFAYKFWQRSIATMETANTLGNDKTSTVFLEYATGRRQLSGFKIVGTRDSQVNLVFQSEATAPPNGTFDTPSTAKWLRLEEVSQFDTGNAAYNNELRSKSVELRKDPRRRLEITMRPDFDGSLPSFGEDYDLGDTVSCRIALTNGTVILRGSVRIHAVQFSVSDNGTETVALTITEES